MSSKRITVAAATQRIPVGALREESDARDSVLEAHGEIERRSVRQPARPVGRPRKDPSEKARNVSITLWPEEADALDALLARVNEGLPATVSRSDVTRLGLVALMRKAPNEIIRGLTELRKRKR